MSLGHSCPSDSSNEAAVCEDAGRTGMSGPHEHLYLMVSVLPSYFTVPVFWFS